MAKIDKKAQELNAANREKLEVTKVKDGSLTINYLGKRFTEPEQLIAEAGIDMDLFEIDRVEISNAEVTGKMHFGQNEDGRWNPQELWKTGNLRIKVTLRRKKDETRALEELLKQIEAKSTICRKYKRRRLKTGKRRSFELAIVDPHLGMRCYKPASQNTWSLEECEEIFLNAIDALLELSKPYQPFEEIVFPFGNDYLHSDNLRHETTAGTLQPEMDAWHHVYERGAELAITAINKLKKLAPVKIYQIPGNHDRQSSFTLGRELKAYFRNDANIEVDAGASPYKFHKYGVNLIGYEHGHSISPVRLAALMANECSGPDNPRKGWYDNSIYREWHLADQHRRGRSKPAVHGEQGVAIEFLTGLTPSNEWSKLKSFNWQQRGAWGCVWDYACGPLHRLQFNLNSVTGKPL